MQNVQDIDDRAKRICLELVELFPGTPFEIETRMGSFNSSIIVRWSDGPALTRVKETGIRERYDRILVEEKTGNKTRTGSIFVKFDRSYSSEALEKAKCVRLYFSYDYVVLSEMDFREEA